MIRKPRFVVFDAVGTLIYPEPAVAEVYHGLALGLGWSGSMDAVQQRFQAAYASWRMQGDPLQATDDHQQKVRWRRLVGTVFPELEYRGCDQLFELLWDHFSKPSSWRVYEDARRCVTQFDRCLIPWCIASNFDGRLERIVAEIDAFRGCKAVFHSAGLAAEKPSGAFYRGVEARLDCAPSELLMVGDDWLNDVEAPKRAGWQSVQVIRNMRPAEAHQVAGLDQLVALWVEK